MRLLLSFSLLVALAGNSLALNAQCLENISIDFSQSSHTVFFVPSYTLMGDEEIVSFLWDLGDGATSTIENPVHTYDNPNTYEVCLTITTVLNDVECSIEVCELIEIVESLPCSVSASFEWLDAGLGSVVLQEFCETNAFTQVTNFYWEGSQGQLEEGTQAEFLFDDLNSPEVCLTVQGISQGNSCSATICKSVELEAPQLSLLPKFIVKANDGCEMRFINTTEEDALENVQYTWTVDGDAIPYEDQPLYQFTENGDHTICLKAEVLWFGEMRIETFCEEVNSDCTIEKEEAHAFEAAAFQRNRNPIEVIGSTFRMASAYTDDQQQMLSYSVYNLQGKMVSTGMFSETQLVELNSLGKGLYVIHILSGKEEHIQKMLIP